MVLDAILSSENVAVIVANTDILILMIYAYRKFMIKRRWVLRHENGKCANTKI